MMSAAVAIVRRTALRNNLHKVRMAAPGCHVLAVIKANAYGHGLVTVARALDGADAFAVARIEEAMQLREAGIGSRIVVLGGFVTGEDLGVATALGLDLVVHDMAQIDVLESLPQARRTDLWLKVDTGMGRLGIEVPEVSAARLRLERWLGDRGALRLLTHLSAAERPADPATPAQLQKFAKLCRGWYGVSVANSAAILQWPQSLQLAGDSGATTMENWVRPGLMLYGASPLPECSAAGFGLQPAMSFETRLLAVKRLSCGRRIGYGGEWQAGRDSVVGVAAAGYADGYPWHNARVTPATLAGIRVPVIGRVSMDMISLDLTEHPGAAAGDRVVLWGEDPPVEEVARQAGTIPYTLLAGLSPRVARQVVD